MICNILVITSGSLIDINFDRLQCKYVAGSGGYKNIILDI